MGCDIKITVGTIWLGLDCMRACMSRCFESELQDKTLLASDDWEMDPSFCFFPFVGLLLSSMMPWSSTCKMRSPSTTPNPHFFSFPLFSFPLSAPQPGMMREGTAEAKVRARVRR